MKQLTPNLNLPNALTGLRIVLVPVLVRLLVDERYGAALGVFAVAGISDALDGFVAKRWNRQTRLGEILDPIADKLLVVSSVVLLSRYDRIPLWLAGAVIGRDVTIVIGALTLRVATGRFQMGPSRLSKLNTVVQIGTILLVLAEGAGVARLGVWLSRVFVVALATTAVSGVQYLLLWGWRMADLSRSREV